MRGEERQVEENGEVDEGAGLGRDDVGGGRSAQR